MINEMVWEWILNTIRHASDNVYIDIIAVTMLFAILMCLFRYVLLKKRILFGIPDAIFVLSVADMVNSLPTIHKRIHQALSTVTGIILQSSDYLEAFAGTTGSDASTSREVASYLYYVQDREALLNTSPTMMYEHLFSALNKTRRLLFLQDVDGSCFMTVSFLFILSLLFLCFMCIVSLAGNGLKSLPVLFLQGVFFLYAVSWSRGAAVCAIVLWFAEAMIWEMFFAEKAEPKDQNTKENA